VNPVDLAGVLERLDAEQHQWRKLALSLGRLRTPSNDAELLHRGVREASIYLLDLGAAVLDLQHGDEDVLRALASASGPGAPFLVTVTMEECIYSARVLERPPYKSTRHCVGQGFGPSSDLARLRAIGVALQVLAARACAGHALPSEVDGLFAKAE
jgi:hypothetical protein